MSVLFVTAMSKRQELSPLQILLAVASKFWLENIGCKTGENNGS